MSIYATIELERSGHQDLPAEFDPDGEGRVYGQDLPRFYERLDALAREVGALPLSTFFDDSLMLSDEEREDAGLPPAEPKWCAADAGLRTVDALIAALEARGQGGGALWDLRVSQAILRRARDAGEKFRYVVL